MFEPEVENLVIVAIKAAMEKQAEEIIAIDVSSRLALTDAFIIASADTQRQVSAIVDFIDEQMHKNGVVATRKEGLTECHWVLLDYGAIVVHVQLTEDREYYDLERLWSDCPRFEIPNSVFGELTGD
ncbi:ribosome silencing factor [Actinomyces sp. zg-332]|uniref:ribosome silencing factor n=1 Tax=Actinomyces sp. zg-332 TaxID=2708340 RepID=UPI0014248220|nr:ribosome silencing factor [Actinomyces sp. zg-332]QPK94461.1 ribosome silencing factor [Actinomyces sp. zg-332]